jgi:hypothetical protein
MTTNRVLYLLGSAAPPVLNVATVIEQAQAAGWNVCLGLTPTAARWLEEELPALEQLTGHPVRSRYKLPPQPDEWPPADVAMLAPATFNTINQWEFIVGFVAEGIGKEIPIVAMPCVNAAYVRHVQFERSIETLRAMGVRVLYGEGGFIPNEPGKGRPDAYPWHLALDAAAELARAQSPQG